MKKLSVAIIGASGYSGQELVRLLLQHPQCNMVLYTSRQYAGKSVADVFPRLRGRIDAIFSAPSTDRILDTKPDVVFLALPHGISAEFVPELRRANFTIIDLSADFRLRSGTVYKEFYNHDHVAPEFLKQAVYGLPELYYDQLKDADLIACPGCYPTSILLAIVPGLKHGLINPNGITVTSMSGVSGAGRKVAEDYLFAECNESIRAYGIPNHRHLSEIEQELSLQNGDQVLISFAPHLVPLTRGMMSTTHMIPMNVHAYSDLESVYRDFYRDKPFVRLTDALPDTKNVAMTNYCDISLRNDQRSNKFIAISAIDNLGKGAAGQAIQCMNIRFGFDETCGLL